MSSHSTHHVSTRHFHTARPTHANAQGKTFADVHKQHKHTNTQQRRRKHGPGETKLRRRTLPAVPCCCMLTFLMVDTWKGHGTPLMGTNKT
eukprot:1373643-Rhodomonas_salina.1